MPRKTLTIAATLAITAAGAAALTAGSASWAAHDAVARLVAANSALSIGAVDTDVFHGRVTLRDVALANGSVRVYARTLSLPMPVSGFIDSAAAAERIQLAQWPTGDKPKEPDAPAASPFSGGIQLKIPGQTKASPTAATPAPPATGGTGSASASDVTIVRGATTYTIKKIDVSGTTLTNADLTALLDPKSPDTTAARLQKLTAGSIVISDVTSDNKTTGSELHAAVTQILLANVASGKIGAASAAASQFSGLSNDKGTVVKTGAIQAAGVDLALLERMITSTRTDDTEALKPLSDAVTVNDVTMTNTDKHTTLTIATISQKGLKARPLKTDMKALNAAGAKDAPEDEAAKKEQSKAIFDDLSSSFEVSAFAIDKITAADSDKDGPATFGIARIALEDYRARKLAGFTLRDVSFAGPNVKFGFATLDLANIVVPAMSKAATPPAADALATDAMPSIAKADIGMIAVDAAMPREDGTISKVKFKLAHLGTSSDQTVGHLPTQGAIAVDNLSFDVPATDSPGAKELLAMGYTHLDVSGALATTYDQKQESLSVQKLLVSGVGMGSLTVALDLGNVGKGILSANPSVAKASALAMLLKRVDLKVVNSGLFEKALDYKAKQDGKTVAEERDTAIDLFAVTLPAALGNGPSIKAVGAAIAKFIAEPKNLHVAAASKDGLGASDMGLIGAPDELLARLDIQAEANQ